MQLILGQKNWFLFYGSKHSKRTGNSNFCNILHQNAVKFHATSYIQVQWDVQINCWAFEFFTHIIKYMRKKIIGGHIIFFFYWPGYMEIMYILRSHPKKRLWLYLSKISTYNSLFNSHLNSHFLLSRSGNSF